MRRNTNLTAIVILLAIGLLGGFFIGKFFYKRYAIRQNIHAKFERIRNLHNQNLVNYYYMEMVPLENELERIQMMLTVPFEVNASMNFHDIEFKVLKDHTIQVELPEPIISTPSPNLEDAVNFDLQSKFGMPGFTRIEYDQSFVQIRKALNDARANVEKRALKGKIRIKAKDLAKIYVQGFIYTLGYDASFIETTADSLKAFQNY